MIWKRISTANCRWTPRSFPEIAARKLPESKVAGRANVLIFPDLNSGNIASKLVRHIGRANAYGQILLGLDRPAADVSRGSNAHDILGVAAIVGVQAIEYHKHPAYSRDAGRRSKLARAECNRIRMNTTRRAFSSPPRARTTARPPPRSA